MFRYKRISLAFFSILAFISCSQEDKNAPQVSDPSSERIQISTSITQGKMSPSMRVTSHQDGTGMFDENDQITCFTDSKSHPWQSHLLTLEKGQWTPNLYWNATATTDEKVNFHAYYPAFKTPAGKETSFYVSADQTNLQGFTASDLLGATCSAGVSQEVVLRFNHLMSHVEVSLQSNDKSFTEAQLNDASVEIKSYLGGKLLLSQNQVGETDASRLEWVKSYKRNGVYSTILFPQPFSLLKEKEDDDDGWIRIKIDNQTILYQAAGSLNGKRFDALQSGHSIKIKLNLQRKQKEAEPIEVSEDVRNKTLWVYGLNMPQNHDWKDGLDWKAEYGWFDCNKSYPQKGGADANLCWAASAADMIHWFLKNNESNIKKYEEISKKKFRGPTLYKDHTHSDVFDWFKKMHPNNGGDTDNGINHFMLGAYISPGAIYNGEVDTIKAGFLYDITGGVNLVTATKRISIRNGMNRQTFNQEIKKALLNKKAIGFSVPRHAMAIWGADFDADENVSAIYYVDNNDTGSGGKLWRKRICFKNNETYMESAVEGYFSFPIIRLVFLELGDKLWKDYFDKHQPS
ncbi:IdeS/Mac family cysteine endopeptidase [Porphyromonas pogonae]|uniref:fimbrillin family protein n=1 Tax=Porphyromonas pogonae TaxID=867595 RepID=UPI002E794381|nr:IdeS/Mac family cysteine endopeptidase [Porphyromonas pogonae]